MTKQSQLVKEASQIPVGGSEDEAKERVKQLFKPAYKDKYARLSEDAIAQIEEERWLDFVQQQASEGWLC